MLILMRLQYYSSLPLNFNFLEKQKLTSVYVMANKLSIEIKLINKVTMFMPFKDIFFRKINVSPLLSQSSNPQKSHFVTRI
jgi:hypothetical protein